jgi:hypothetical protein
MTNRIASSRATLVVALELAHFIIGATLVVVLEPGATPASLRRKAKEQIR